MPTASGAVPFAGWQVEGTASPVEQLEMPMFPTGNCTIQIDQGTNSVKRSVVDSFPVAFGVDLKANTTPRIRVKRANQTFLDFTVAPVSSNAPAYLSYTPLVDMSSIEEDVAGPAESELPNEEDVVAITRTAVPQNSEREIDTRGDPSDGTSALIFRVHTSTGQSILPEARLKGELFLWSTTANFTTTAANRSLGAVVYTGAPSLASNTVGFRINNSTGQVFVAHGLDASLDLRIWVQRVSFQAQPERRCARIRA